MQVRRETLPIAKKLNKFIDLPHQQSWKVHDADVLARGKVMSIMRTKRMLFFDDLSTLKMRIATVTRHGFLVLYEELDKGLIVDLRGATHIMTTTDKYKSRKTSYRRGHIKVRLPRGNLHLFVRDEDVHRWTSAILAAHTAVRPKPIIRPVEILKKDDGHENETTINMLTETENQEASTSSAKSTSSNSGLITVIENPKIAPIPSIRKGGSNVNSLRRMLEKKFVARSVADAAQIRQTEQDSSQPNESEEMNTPKRFVSSVFVFHQGQEPPIRERKNEVVIVPQSEFVVPPMAEESERSTETFEVTPTPKPRKEWWMRSLRC